MIDCFLEGKSRNIEVKWNERPGRKLEVFEDERKRKVEQDISYFMIFTLEKSLLSNRN